MNVQEQEEREYCPQTELEMLGQQERMEQPVVDERARARELTRQGKFVVCQEYEVCGRFTDALLGIAFAVLSVHDTEADAVYWAGDQDFEFAPFVYREPTSEPLVRIAVSTEDLPF